MRTTAKQNLEIARTTAKQKNFFFLTAECVCYKRHITLPSSMVHQVGHVKLTASSKQSACVLSNIKNFFPCGISCGSSCKSFSTMTKVLLYWTKNQIIAAEEGFQKTTSSTRRVLLQVDILLTSAYIVLHLCTSVQADVSRCKQM